MTGLAKIWTKNGFVTDDPWVVESEEIKAGSNEKAILPIDAFIAEAASGKTGLGVLVTPADDLVRLQPFVAHTSLVAVAFPAFNDGRAFSHASLLRTRLNYAGEIRAVGDVLIDQIPLMQRCGIDSFSVINATALRRLSENRLPGLAEHYQPAAQSSAETGSYSWRRISKTAAAK